MQGIKPLKPLVCMEAFETGVGLGVCERAMQEPSQAHIHRQSSKCAGGRSGREKRRKGWEEADEEEGVDAPGSALRKRKG